MKRITVDEFNSSTKRNAYNFKCIKVGDAVEFSEKETGKTVKYLAAKVHSHAYRTGKKFKTHSIQKGNDVVIRILRIL